MINYVENKKINWDRVKSYLKESEESKQWTNFGPVAKRLEKRIAEILMISNELKIVVTSSGTAALHGIINMHEYIAKRPLKWVVSAFGFPCTKQGPLKNAQVIDCNSQGKLDPKNLEGLDYDGVVATDPFSQMSIWNYQCLDAHCKQKNKILVFDSCGAFSSQIRYTSNASCAMSFHHTKPWGIGEGGCAIIAGDYRERFKAMINFGFFNKQPSGIDTAMNGKMSDLNAAFILDRLEDIKSIKKTHEEQYHRIMKIGGALRMPMMCGNGMAFSIPPNVPLLAPIPVSNKECDRFAIEKYYKPLADGCPMAERLFSRIVNVPCHTEMEQLSDAEIFESLRKLLYNQPI